MIDYNLYLNDNIKKIKPSGIRRFFDIANQMDDVISLSIGEPDFATPFHIRQTAIDSLEKGQTWYTPNRGFTDLRNEISKYFLRRFDVSYNPSDEILVTVGGSEAIDLCVRALVNPGDEVLIPQPSFVCYAPIAEMSGATPIIIDTKEENKFRLTKADLEKHITEKTKFLILPYPNNPTGAVMTKEELVEIAKIVKKHDLFVMSDEIYAELSYLGERYTTFSKIEGMRERTVVVSGFSKSYAMTGWRLGYALGPKEIISQMTKLHQFAIMSAPTTSQYAAIEALKHGDQDIENMRTKYDMRRRFLVSELNKMGLRCFNPEGAFYVFPCIKSTGLSSEEFCKQLILKKHVAIIPGTAFGKSGEGYVRVSYSYSLSHIEKALKRIKSFLEDLKSGGNNGSNS